MDSEQIWKANIDRQRGQRRILQLEQSEVVRRGLGRRSIGQGMDGDGLSYSVGSTLVQSAGHVWNLSLRYTELNRVGPPDNRHTLSATPQELMDVQLSHTRATRFGRFHAGVGYSRLDDELTGETSSDISGFVSWSSQ